EVPIKITVSNDPIPEGIDVASRMDGQVHEELIISHPGLIAGEGSPDADDFDFYCYVQGQSNDKNEAGDYTYTFDEPGYYFAQLTMSYANIHLNKTVVLAISEDGTPLPDKFYKLNREEINETHYKHEGAGQHSWQFIFNDYLPALGTPYWSLTYEYNNVLSNLYLDNHTGQDINLCYDGLVGTGTVNANLTCTFGDVGYTIDIPITLQVVEAVVPTYIQSPALYEGTINDDIVISRPALIPEGTDFTSDQFEFGCSLESEPIASTQDSFTYRFDTAGFYRGFVHMTCGNIHFFKNFVIAIADNEGNIPGNAIRLDRESIDETHYIYDGDEGYSWNINVWDADSYPNIQWNIIEVSGSEVTNLYLDSQGENWLSIRYDSLLAAGTVSATLVGTSGAYTTRMPITLRVEEAIVPTGLDIADRIDGQVHVPLTIHRPALIAEDGALADHIFEFSWSVNNYYNYTWDEDNNRVYTFDQAGYYVARVTMSHANVLLNKNVLLAISDGINPLPDSVITPNREHIKDTLFKFEDASDYAWDVYVTSEDIGLGSPTWELSNLSVPDSLQLDNTSDQWTALRCNPSSVSTGTITATLVCSAGGFETELPVEITVTDQLPNGIGLPSIITGVAGEAVQLTRPGLKPEGYPVPADAFSFHYDVPGAEVSGDAESGYIVTFEGPGYYPATVYMSCTNLHLSQPLVFAIAEVANGEVPGQLIELKRTDITETHFLEVGSENPSWHIYIQNDVSSLVGDATWQLKDVSGESVSILRLQNPDWYSVYLCYDNMVVAGTTTATLVCKVGPYEEELPIAITVTDDPVPTGFVMPHVIHGVVNSPVHFAHPSVLLPEETTMSSALFELNCYVLDEKVPGNPEEGYAFTFTEAGYHHAYVRMEYGNIYLSKNIVFAIANEVDGEVPGQLIKLYPSIFEKTQYLKAGNGSHSWHIGFENDLSAFGTPVWKLEDVQGDAIKNMDLSEAWGGATKHYDDALEAVGTTTATLVCTIGDHQASLPISITVSDVDVPTDLAINELTIHTQVDQPVLITRPGLLPAGHGVSEDLFSFDWYGSGYSSSTSVESGFKIFYDEPGYYTITLRMQHGNIYLSREILVIVTDEDGTLPEKTDVSSIQ
ncbi:MAG: hypothetical protein GX808_14600, partial [Syntrophomonadaceae bacterium]|nr:hypothetical protein [Syntrophomonadaceae bacterium]